MLSSLENQHKNIMDVYSAGKSTNEFSLSDRSGLIKNHRFIRDDQFDKNNWDKSWQLRMARRYYDKLFKEYALADLSRYKEKKIGMRWRSRAEVIEGKGQFVCGCVACSNKIDLHTYEVPFKYNEEGTIKFELVKIRVCTECSKKYFMKKLWQ